MESCGDDQISSGILFHDNGPATAKASSHELSGNDADRKPGLRSARVELCTSADI